MTSTTAPRNTITRRATRKGTPRATKASIMASSHMAVTATVTIGVTVVFLVGMVFTVDMVAMGVIMHMAGMEVTGVAMVVTMDTEVTVALEVMEVMEVTIVLEVTVAMEVMVTAVLAEDMVVVVMGVIIRQDSSEAVATSLRCIITQRGNLPSTRVPSVWVPAAARHASTECRAQVASSTQTTDSTSMAYTNGNKTPETHGHNWWIVLLDCSVNYSNGNRHLLHLFLLYTIKISRLCGFYAVVLCFKLT